MGRDSKGRWQPGTSGGPGRPKSFATVAKMIMDATGDGAELVQWALDTWRDPERSHAERAAAHAWLSDRGLGKAVAQHELNITAAVPQLPPNIGAMSRDERVAWFKANRPELLLGEGDSE